MAHSVIATVVLLCLLVIGVGASVPISRVSALNAAESTQDIVSNWSVYPVTFDGKVSNEVEWAEAQPQNVVLYHWDPQSRSWLVNDSLTATYYVKNDAQWLYLLVHVNSTKISSDTSTSIQLFWPTWNGTEWPQSDSGGVGVASIPFDQYGWNETRWQWNEPNNVKGAASCNLVLTDCWFEYAKMLQSGDKHDWNLNQGDPVGGSPPYLQVGIWFGETSGWYGRSVRLYLAKGDFPSFFGPIGPVAVFEMPSGSMVYGLSLDYDGSLVAVGLRNPAELRLYSRNGSLLWKRTIENSWAANSVAISSDGKFLAVGGDSSLEFYSANGTRLWWKRLHYVYSVAISGVGSRVFYSSERELGLVDWKGNYLWTDMPANHMGGVSMSPDGDYLAAVVESDFYPIDVGARMLLYDKAGSLLWDRKLPEITSSVGSRYSAPAISNGADAIAVLGQDSRLVVFDRNGSIKWWIRDSGVLFIPSFGGRLLAMPSDGRYVAAALGGASYASADVHLFSPNGSDWGSLKTQQGAAGFRTLGMSPDGSYVTGGSWVTGEWVFVMIGIPNAAEAVDFLSRAVEFGSILGIRRNETGRSLLAAREELIRGSLAAAYDISSHAYNAIESDIKSRLLQLTSETKHELESTNAQLNSIKSAGVDPPENISAHLSTDAEMLANAEMYIKAGTLTSYEKAFKTLQAVKQSLLQDQSLLSRYGTNQSSTLAQVAGQPFPFTVVTGLVATVLILSIVVRRIRLRRRRPQP